MTVTALRFALCLLLAGCAEQDFPDTLQSMQDLKVATVELASGDAAAALQVAQTVLATNPRNTLALVLAGNAQSALGQRDVADASFHQALNVDPHLLDASLGLARLELARNPAQAVADFTALLRRRPDDARIWTDLGVAYDLQSKPQPAQDAYRHAMRQDQSLVSAQADLGLSLALSGQAEEGIALLGPLVARPQCPPRVRQDLAVAEAMAGNRAAAQQVLNQDLPTEQVASALAGFSNLKEAGP